MAYPAPSLTKHIAIPCGFCLKKYILILEHDLYKTRNIQIKLCELLSIVWKSEVLKPGSSSISTKQNLLNKSVVTSTIINHMRFDDDSKIKCVCARE